MIHDDDNRSRRALMNPTPILRYLIPALVIVNLLLLARLMGWIPGVFGDLPDPGRIQTQINREQVRMVPGSAEPRR